MLVIAERALSFAVGDLFEVGHCKGPLSPPGPTCCIQPLSQAVGRQGEHCRTSGTYITWINKVKDMLVVIANVSEN